MNLGKYNTLTVRRFTANGAYLVDETEKEVLLPNKYVPVECREGDLLDVFIFQDHEHRITATTVKPKLLLHQVAFLKVKSTTTFGAFLDWGLPKDLFVPLREQKRTMQEGHYYFVYLTIDELTGRLNGSAKVENIIKTVYSELKPKDTVDALIYRETQIGYEVIINQTCFGLIYKNEIFSPLRLGDHKVAYVKQVREDGKIDLSLQPLGYEHIDNFVGQLLDALEQHNGFLPLHDQSTPDEIMQTLGMSKKNFKKSVGSLFKAKKITLSENGIRLLGLII